MSLSGAEEDVELLDKRARFEGGLFLSVESSVDDCAAMMKYFDLVLYNILVYTEHAELHDGGGKIRCQLVPGAYMSARQSENSTKYQAARAHAYANKI
jgi:hypothetical protein